MKYLQAAALCCFIALCVYILLLLPPLRRHSYSVGAAPTSGRVLNPSELSGGPVAPIARPKVHREFTRTYELLPSHTATIDNSDFTDFEIRSQFPVQLIAGTCQENSVVQYECHMDRAHDIFFRDLRMTPIFRQPQSNAVTIVYKTDD